MRLKRFVYGLIMALYGIDCALANVTSSVPDASYASGVNNSSGNISIATSGSIESTGPGSSGSASIIDGLDPVLSATASAVYNPLTGSDFVASVAMLHYFYQVEGPQNIAIPIHIVASAVTSVINPSYYTNAWAILNISNLTFEACSGSITGCPSSFNLDTTIEITSNTIYDVYINANADTIGATNGDVSSATASIDPLISIDPTFGDLSDYTLVVSPQAFSDVPEPASAVIVIGGLAALGAFQRQRLSRGGSHNRSLDR